MRCLSEFFAFFEQRFEISGICDGSFMMLDARINSIKHRLVRSLHFIDYQNRLSKFPYLVQACPG